MENNESPEHLELRRSEGLEVRWRGGKVSFFPIAFLRRMSPSADAEHGNKCQILLVRLTSDLHDLDHRIAGARV